jgi:hypothetical protein
MLEHSMSLASTKLILPYEELNHISVNLKKKIQQNAESAVVFITVWNDKTAFYLSSNQYKSCKAVVT